MYSLKSPSLREASASDLAHAQSAEYRNAHRRAPAQPEGENFQIMRRRAAALTPLGGSS